MSIVYDSQGQAEKRSGKIDTRGIDDIKWVKAFVTGIRTIHSEMNIAPGKKIPL